MVQVVFTQIGSWLREVTINVVPVDSDKLTKGDLCQKGIEKEAHFLARSFPWKHLSN